MPNLVGGDGLLKVSR